VEKFNYGNTSPEPASGTIVFLLFYLKLQMKLSEKVISFLETCPRKHSPSIFVLETSVEVKWKSFFFLGTCLGKVEKLYASIVFDKK